MPVVTIEWFEGRSADQKREIAERLTDLLAEVGKMPADQVWIRFVDSPKADWAIGGEIQGPNPPAEDGDAFGPP
ncbi:MAG: 4-oxalocrotonate tautomerase family protein, partial [Thermoleophilaceae bacterium]|nr:4-oxalocrotonate tautomerase family protein [Thermoleophilaceae bacterium]